MLSAISIADVQARRRDLDARWIVWSIVLRFTRWNGGPRESRVKAFIDIKARYPFLPAFKTILAEPLGDDGWRAVRAPQLALTEPQRIALLEQLHAAGLLAARETNTDNLATQQ